MIVRYCYTVIFLIFHVQSLPEHCHCLTFGKLGQLTTVQFKTKNKFSAPKRRINSKIPSKFNSSSRREWLKRVISISTVPGISGFVTTSSQASFAAETIGKDPNCNDSSCLGVWDGLLADCPHGKLAMNSGAGCASSQDDTPGVFAEPWDYSEAPNNAKDWETQMRLLLPEIELVSSKRGDKCSVLIQSGRYLRVLFVDGKTAEESIGEFYFTPEDTTVQFRVGSLSMSSGAGAVSKLLSSSTKNLDRCELIRKELRYLKVPVLRNRKRTLFFVESDFDTFGPRSASLGPPEEMTTGELEGKQYEDRKSEIDLLRSFPISK